MPPAQERGVQILSAFFHGSVLRRSGRANEACLGKGQALAFLAHQLDWGQRMFVTIKARVYTDATGVYTELPALLTPTGVLTSLLDYCLCRSHDHSLMWMMKGCLQNSEKIVR
ncbi:hypothetical protein A3218_05855 [Pseudomonas chlororaphis]|uniref:hypothetical protein n=1 Tax=Pseudomonas chlororaphis TaxID=587753 RepID=UPI000789D728|nr:hypothetical protein [Pseudomonas chlororaphis]AMS13837.1 hypothetical protein A3218_05855 [Pseudomonas chlororaphis]